MLNRKNIIYIGLLLIGLSGCALSLESTTKTLVDNLTKNSEVFKNRKIAVIDIVILESGKSIPLTKVITENINTELIDKISLLHGKLLERSQITAILKEYKFQFSDLADPNTTKKLGKALGADLIVTGTLSESHRQLNVRIIEIESFSIVAGNRQTISKRLFSTKKDKKVTATSTNYWEAFSVIGVIGIVLVLFYVALIKSGIRKYKVREIYGIISMLIFIISGIYSISSIEYYYTWSKLLYENAPIAYGFGVGFYSLIYLYAFGILLEKYRYSSFDKVRFIEPESMIFIGFIPMIIFWIGIRLVLVPNFNIYELMPLY